MSDVELYRIRFQRLILIQQLQYSTTIYSVTLSLYVLTDVIEYSNEKNRLGDEEFGERSLWFDVCKSFWIRELHPQGGSEYCRSPRREYPRHEGFDWETVP